MRGDGRHVVRFALDHRARANAALDFTGDAVPVSFGKQPAVYEHAPLDRGKIASLPDHLFQKQHGTLGQLPRFLFQIAVLFEFDHVHQPVEADQRLLGGVAGFDVVHMPGDVSPLVRRNRGLDVRACQLADHHVEHVRHRCLARAGLDVLRVHLRAHAVARKEPAQRNRIRQIHIDAGPRRCRRRHGREADVPLRHADLAAIERVDRVLHHQFRHDLPGVPRGRVCVVRAVDLRHVCPFDELLALRCVHKRTHHVDVAVDHVVLRVLMATVDALLREHDRNVRPGHAADVAVVVDRAADLVLDEIERFSLRAHLLARNRHATAALRGSLDQSVKVALAGGANHHDVIRAMVRGHAHATNVVLKAPARDFGRDHRHRLRIDVFEIVRGRQRHAILEGFAAIAVGKRPHRQVRRGLAPSPTTAAGTVMLQIFENLRNVDVFVRRQAIVAHLAPPNSFAASSSFAGFNSASPASRIGRLFCLA